MSNSSQRVLTAFWEFVTSFSYQIVTAFFRGENLPEKGWYARQWIMQESTFWRRALWERGGGNVDSSLRFAGDFELWTRFYQYAQLYSVATPLSGFRMYDDQKTVHHRDDYVQEAKQVFFHYGGRPYGKLEAFVRSRVIQYLPWRFRPIAAKLNLLYPRKVCKYTVRQGKWKISTTYR